jgi:hypothetical protein
VLESDFVEGGSKRGTPLAITRPGGSLSVSGVWTEVGGTDVVENLDEFEA